MKTKIQEGCLQTQQEKDTDEDWQFPNLPNLNERFKTMSLILLAREIPIVVANKNTVTL